MTRPGEEQTFDQGFATAEDAAAAGLFDDLSPDDFEDGDSGAGDASDEYASDEPALEAGEEDEGAQEEDAAGDDADEGDSEGEEETAIQTLEDLADRLEVEAKDLDDVEIPLTIDGEETTMTIAGLRDMAKTNRQAQWTGAFQQLAERRRDTDRRASELAEQQRQAAEVNAQLLQEIESTLLGDQQELVRLAAEKSPLYFQKHQAFMQRQQRVEQIKSVVGMQRDDAEDRGNGVSEAKRQSEAELFYLHHPELAGDQEAANRAMTSVGRLMHKLGWSVEEIQNTVDHRMLRLALMAASQDGQTERAVQSIRKKLSKPKGRKALKGRGAGQRSKTAIANAARAHRRLADTGSEDAFVDVITAEGLV